MHRIFIYSKFVLLFCILFVNTIISTSVFASGDQFTERFRIWDGVPSLELKKVKSELTVFQPSKNISNRSAIIICPGGSYAWLGMKVEGYEVAKWLNQLGFTAFVLRYRVGFWWGYHYPSSIQDLQRSIQLVRENAQKWDIDAAKVGVMGFSAGGHLAGTAAEYYNENFMQPLGVFPKVSLRPDFVVMNYPVVSMHDSIAHRKSKHYLMASNRHSKELENKLSLEDNLHKDMPPVFLMQVKGDKTVDYRNSVYLNRNMCERNVSVHFVLYDGNGHGFGVNANKNPIARKWTAECAKWFVSIGLKINQGNPDSNECSLHDSRQ